MDLVCSPPTTNVRFFLPSLETTNALWLQSGLEHDHTVPVTQCQISYLPTIEKRDLRPQPCHTYPQRHQTSFDELDSLRTTTILCYPMLPNRILVSIITQAPRHCYSIIATLPLSLHQNLSSLHNAVEMPKKDTL
jgi:hypothetical protein